MEVDPPPTGVPDGWSVVPRQEAAQPARAPGQDFKVLGVNIHVPAEEKSRADSNIVGWGEHGAGVAPEDALIGGSIIRNIAKATAEGGALAGLRSSLANAAPMVKYEATKTVLQHLGVPGPLAAIAANAVAGYSKGAKGAAATETPVETAPSAVPKSTAQPVAAAPMPPEFAPTGAPIAAPARAAGSTVAPAVSAREQELLDKMGGRGPVTLPDQKALNEAALARRRAEYQASQAQPASVPMDFQSKEERTAFLRLVDAGLSREAAAKAVLNARALVARLGTPSTAEAAAQIAARQYKQ